MKGHLTARTPGWSLPQLALLLANLVPVFGVLYLDWDVSSIIVLYWAENLVIGGFTLLKMLVAGKAGALFRMLFFCVHYGGFCAIHGIFVLELTRFAGEHFQPAAAASSAHWAIFSRPQAIATLSRKAWCSAWGVQAMGGEAVTVASACVVISETLFITQSV